MSQRWAALALLLATGAWAQTAEPLADLNTRRSPFQSTVSGLTQVGARVVFSANTRRGVELWASDGTDAGTLLLADLAAGEASASPFPVAVVNGQLVFTARDEAGRALVGVTDGTRSGTRLLLPAGSASVLRGALTGTGARLALLLPDPPRRLAFTDGTPGSVRFVTAPPDQPGGPGLQVGPGVGDKVFLLGGNDAGTAFAVWESDGTEVGTRMLPVSVPSQAFSSQWLKGLDRPLFVARLPGAIQLWATDGTPGRTEALAFFPNGNSVSSAVAGNTLALAPRSLFQSCAPLSLWDGAGALRQVPDFCASQVVPLGRQFLAAQSAFGAVQLALVDPTSAIASPLRGDTGGLAQLTEGVVRSFAGVTGGNPQRTTLLSIEASGAVTEVLRAEELSGATTTPAGVGWFGLRATSSERNTLWRSEGTPETTRPVTEVNPGNDGSNPQPVGRAGARALLTATNTPLVAVAPGDRAVEELLPSDAGVLVLGAAVSVGRSAVFLASTQALGTEPWVTDGTRKGTRLLRDLAPQFLSSAARGFTRLGGRLLFSANDQLSGDEPWVTDGTPEGTSLLADLRGGSAGSVMGDPAVAEGRAYFAADDGLSGRELWATDGTSAGTARVADLVPGPAGSAPSQVTAMGAGVVWVGRGPGSDEALWRLEPGGAPRPATATGPGAAGSEPSIIQSAGAAVLFTAGPASPRAWYGLTADAGVVALPSLPAPTALLESVGTSRFAALRFRAADGGVSLWTSTGQATQTQELGAFSFADSLAAVGPLAFFRASSIDSGSELWVTDGTAAGTRQYVEVASDALSSSPGPVTWVGKWLVFAASGDTYDREPWRVDLPAGLDNTPPEVRGSVEGPRTDAGWLTGTGTLRFTIEDPDSPVQSEVGCAETPITEDTAGRAYTCTARSLGGEASATVTVRRDTTPPVLRCPDGGTFESADGGALQLDLGVPSATDAIDPAPRIAVQGTLVGAFPLGRTTVQVTARDEAGSLSQCTVEVEVTLPRREVPPPSAPGCGCATTVPGGLAGLLALLALRRGRRR